MHLGAEASAQADILLRGYIGWNTRRALQVMDKVFPKDSAVQPSLVIVYFGGNDSIAAHSSGLGPHVPLDEYIGNMRKIAEHLKSLSEKTRVIFLSCPPLNEEMLQNSTSSTILSEIVRTNETCRLYSDACVALCKEMNLKVVDLWHAMQKREDWMTACFTDGLHLSEEGSNIVVEEILKVLKEAEWEPCLHWKAMPTEFAEDSCYGGCCDREDRGGRDGSGGGATVPARYSAAGTVHVGERQAARAVRGAGNAGRGASPTAGKREGIPKFHPGFRRRMYGRRASQLLKEIDSSEAGQLAPFNSDVFDQVIRECNEHNSQFQSLIRKMVEQNLDIETTRNEDHYGAAIHHLSLLRNKRCLMAYMYNRAEVIQSFRWKVGPVLPHDIQEKLHFSEKEYFKNHSAAIKSYISEMDIDLTVDMVPPKDPYIQVRVLEDIGEVSLGDHSVSLTKNSLHFLRRTDTEQFISQGLMEEFLE